MATRRTITAKDGAAAIAMLDAEKRVAAEPAADGTDQRRCIGSAKFGIEAHEAPAADFPIQPSQKDGLGRMCKPHWNEYTSALRKAALARKATQGEPGEGQATPAPVRAGPAKPGPSARKGRARKAEAVVEPAAADATHGSEA